MDHFPTSSKPFSKPKSGFKASETTLLMLFYLDILPNVISHSINNDTDYISRGRS